MVLGPDVVFLSKNKKCFNSSKMQRQLGLLLLSFSVVVANAGNNTTPEPGSTVNNNLLHAFFENPQRQISTLEQLYRNKSTNGTNNSTEYEIYKENKPEAVEVTSDNFPNPYPATSHKFWNLTTGNSTGFELIIGCFDISPQTDFLKFHLGGVETDEEDSGIVLTGKLKATLAIRSPNSQFLQIEFSSNAAVGHTHKGFSLTYAPFGELPELTTKPPEEITIAPIAPPSYSALLTVLERYQTNETWSLFRHLLCEAANNYTTLHNLTLEACQPQNVTFVSITRCSNLWPNNMNCVEITFRIILSDEQDESIVTTVDPLNGPEIKFPSELSAENLEAMWKKYGEAIFKENKFPPYNPPKTNGLILFWAGMASAALIVFIMFLIIISRLRLLEHYMKRPAVDEDNQNILKKSQEIDITMFPSPHQIVPTLFPTSTNPYSPGSSFLYGGDVYENRPRDAIECFNETDPHLLSGLRRSSSFGMDVPTLPLDCNDNERLHQVEPNVKGATQDDSIS